MKSDAGKTRSTSADAEDRLAVLRAELVVERASLRYVPEQEVPFVAARIAELHELIALAERPQATDVAE